MENFNNENTVQPNINYYKLVKHHLQKNYGQLSEKEIGVLAREAIFAPDDYQVVTPERTVPIKSVRQNLANSIEHDASTRNSTPYSLEANIADLIEQSGCETSSMNEYYRWISTTADILRHSHESNVTHHDLDERNGFLKMSYDREAEILLCLALYQGSNQENNKSKMDMLRFKLARLREMRSMVANTTNHVKRKIRITKELIQKYREHLQKISQEIYISFDINLNLKLNDDKSDYADLDETYSHLATVQARILHMMRMYELSQQNRELDQEKDKDKNKNNTDELSLSTVKTMTSSSRDSLEI